MATLYMTVAQVIEARRLALEVSESDDTGAANYGAIESILDHISNDQYYPAFEDKITHLFFGLAKFHCFTDGNKRTSLAATLYMLLLNGHHRCARTFLQDVEDLVVHVAANRIGKPLLHKIVKAKLDHSFDENESLKLEILEAISVGIDPETL